MKLLIVNDDLATRSYLARLLAELGTCEVAVAGLQAVDAFREALDAGQPFDVVLLDSILSDMSGADIRAALRNLERQRGVADGERARLVLLATPWLQETSAGLLDPAVEVVLPQPAPVETTALLAQLHRWRRSPESAVAAGAPPATKPASSTSTSSEGESARPRFLIVDDDRLCRVLVHEILANVGDCDQVANGMDAVEAVRRAIEAGRPYDAVTLDIMMPDMDGHATLERIRELEQEHGIVGLQGTKVIMSTALHDSKHCVQAFREGCEGYVTKPLDEGQLLAKLTELGIIDLQSAHA